jgi:hypothetical protein
LKEEFVFEGGPLGAEDAGVEVVVVAASLDEYR